jgi:hypothetical protein
MEKEVVGLDLSSSTFTVPKGVTSIDVFCVGGGEGGTEFYYIKNVNGTSYSAFASNPGGGGGNFITAKNISVSSGSSIAVIVGAGGYSYYVYFSTGGYYRVNKGGTSSIGAFATTSEYFSNGGAGAYIGNDGGYMSAPISSIKGNGKNGSASSAHYFGESNGTLYAGGGGGGGLTYMWGNDKITVTASGGYGVFGGGNGTTGSAGSANTGGGGGGTMVSLFINPFASSSYYTAMAVSADGGSGIAIIRWGK